MSKMMGQRLKALRRMFLLQFILIFHRVESSQPSLSYQCLTSSKNTNIQPLEITPPVLPEQFIMHVEVNVVQKQITMEAIEVYDFPNKRAAISITTNNETFTSIFNYSSSERYDLMPDGSCKTVNLSDVNSQVFGFTQMGKNGRATIMTAAEVFKTGGKFNITFIGESVVRGIPVYQWHSCQTWDLASTIRAAYAIEYFFSKPDYSSATKATSIPVRIVVNGSAINEDSSGSPIEGTHNFFHIYDFSFFHPGPIHDDSIFEIPRGTVCTDRLLNKPLPTLPDQFSLSVEAYIDGSHYPSIGGRMLFDHGLDLIQTDHFKLYATGKHYGTSHLTIVKDYHNRIEYYIDTYNNHCSVSPMPGRLSTSNEDSMDHMTRLTKQELLLQGQYEFVYQGQRRLRDMQVDVWANESESGVIQEVYFQADWPPFQMNQQVEHLEVLGKNILVGVYLLNTSQINKNFGLFGDIFNDKLFETWEKQWQMNEQPSKSKSSIEQNNDSSSENRKLRNWRRDQWSSETARFHFPPASEKLIHIFNYSPIHTDSTTFDVSICYGNSTQKLYVYVLLEVYNFSNATVQNTILLSSVRSEIAKAMNISLLRISNMNLWHELFPYQVSIFFTLLGPPPINSTSDHLSAKNAFKNLASAIQHNLTIMIKHPLHPIYVHVVHGSLQSLSSIKEMWNKTASTGQMGQLCHQQPELLNATTEGQSTIKEGSLGFTTVQFGGMACAMLLLGILVGVGGMYMILLRIHPDIHLNPPYRQSR